MTAEGYVAITDFEWYSYLITRPDLEEVNFWQPRPGGLLRRERAGMPFFFKLKSRHGSAIVGFGTFAWSTRLPAWMAWDHFREANGAPDRAAMLARIARIRRDPVVDTTGRYEIGCLLISSPIFFEQSKWVRGPGDWPGSVERGKTYDLSEGEGQRILQECQERARAYPPVVRSGAGADVHGVPPEERFGRPFLVRPRLRQGGFRTAVADAYGRMCAVTTEHSLPALEAAHIRRYADGGEHEIRNGLFLRADIHRLFDLGFVAVTPEYQFVVSDRLRTDYANGRVYYELQERIQKAGRIHLPADPAFRPDPELLAWHMKERFVA